MPFATDEALTAFLRLARENGIKPKKYMSPENTQKLINIYPALFQGIDPMMPFSLFSFECGNGWFDLLKECIEAIKEIDEREKLDLQVHQIKEKYGTLRFYLNYYVNEVEEVIRKAEERSEVTCEHCGAPATVRKVSPWYVRCCCDACLDAPVEPQGEE